MSGSFYTGVFNRCRSFMSLSATCLTAFLFAFPLSSALGQSAPIDWNLARDLVNRALQTRDDGDLVGAQKILEEVMIMTPKDTNTQRLLGNVNWSLEREPRTPTPSPINIKAMSGQWVKVKDIPVLYKGKASNRASESEIRAAISKSGVEYVLVSINPQHFFALPLKLNEQNLGIAPYSTIDKIYPITPGSNLHQLVEKIYQDYGSKGVLKAYKEGKGVLSDAIEQALLIQELDAQLAKTPKASGRIFGDFSFGDTLKIALEKLSENEQMSLLSVVEGDEACIITLIAKIGEFPYMLDLFFPNGKLNTVRFTPGDEESAMAAYNRFLKNSEKRLDQSGVVTVMINGESVTIGEQKALRDASMDIFANMLSVSNKMARAAEGKKYLWGLLSLRYKPLEGSKYPFLYNDNQSAVVSESGNAFDYKIYILSMHYFLETEKSDAVSKLNKMLNEIQKIAGADKIANELF